MKSFGLRRVLLGLSGRPSQGQAPCLLLLLLLFAADESWVAGHLLQLVVSCLDVLFADRCDPQSDRVTDAAGALDALETLETELLQAVTPASHC